MTNKYLEVATSLTQTGRISIARSVFISLQILASKWLWSLAEIEVVDASRFHEGRDKQTSTIDERFEINSSITDGLRSWDRLSSPRLKRLRHRPRPTRRAQDKAGHSASVGMALLPTCHGHVVSRKLALNTTISCFELQLAISSPWPTRLSALSQHPIHQHSAPPVHKFPL